MSCKIDKFFLKCSLSLEIPEKGVRPKSLASTHKEPCRKSCYFLITTLRNPRNRPAFKPKNQDCPLKKECVTGCLSPRSFEDNLYHGFLFFNLLYQHRNSLASNEIPFFTAPSLHCKPSGYL